MFPCCLSSCTYLLYEQTPSQPVSQSQCPVASLLPVFPRVSARRAGSAAVAGYHCFSIPVPPSCRLMLLFTSGFASSMTAARRHRSVAIGSCAAQQRNIRSDDRAQRLHMRRVRSLVSNRGVHPVAMIRRAVQAVRCGAAYYRERMDSPKRQRGAPAIAALIYRSLSSVVLRDRLTAAARVATPVRTASGFATAFAVLVKRAVA